MSDGKSISTSSHTSASTGRRIYIYTKTNTQCVSMPFIINITDLHVSFFKSTNILCIRLLNFSDHYLFHKHTFFLNNDTDVLTDSTHIVIILPLA